MHLSMCFSSLLCIIIEDLVLIRNYIWRSFKNIILIVLLFFPLLTLSHSFPFCSSFTVSSIIYLFIFQHFHFGVLLLLFCYFSHHTSFVFSLVFGIISLVSLSLSISCYSIHHNNKGCLKGKHVVILLSLRDKNRS